jgi:glycosyltransferase involved in cell wall biosynthesis
MRQLPAPAPNGAVRFGLFGRLVSLKGSHFAVAALRRVVQAGVTAEVHFFGTGPDQSAVVELARSLALERSIHLHGSYRPSELDRLVAPIDVGLMPSIYEGFGLVMLELMARGRPVIASDAGSAQEVLGRLGGGMVVDRADTASLGNAMLCYCRDPNLVRRDGQRARHVWEEHFTPELMIDRYLRFWRSEGVTLES